MPGKLVMECGFYIFFMVFEKNGMIYRIFNWGTCIISLMKRFVLIVVPVIIVLAVVVLLFALRGGKETEIEAESEAEIETTAVTEITKELSEEKESVVLILGIDAKDKSEFLKVLCGRYDLSVVYDYSNFSLAAVKTNAELTAAELDQLMEDLRGEDGIISVERDQVYQLDDSVVIDNRIIN